MYFTVTVLPFFDHSFALTVSRDPNAVPSGLCYRGFISTAAALLPWNLSYTTTRTGNFQVRHWVYHRWGLDSLSRCSHASNLILQQRPLLDGLLRLYSTTVQHGRQIRHHAHSDGHDIIDLTHLLSGARQYILHSIIRYPGTIILLWMRKDFQPVLSK